MQAYLTIISGDDEGKLFLVKDPTVIGRAPACEARLENDPKVSNRHAKIMLKDSFFALQDLHTRNGTSVNGHTVGIHYLSPGDVIGVGDTQLRFSVSEADSGVSIDDGLKDHVEVLKTGRPARSRRTPLSRSAIAALVFALGGCGPWDYLWIFTVVGLLLAVWALVDIRRRSASSGAWLAAIALAVGVASGGYHLHGRVYLPLAGKRLKAQSHGNLLRIRDAMSRYVTEHAGKYPKNLDDLYPVYVRSRQTLRCPAAEAKGLDAVYIYIGAGKVESDKPVPLVIDPQALAHDEQGGYVLHSDGRIEWLGVERRASLLEEVGWAPE